MKMLKRVLRNRLRTSVPFQMFKGLMYFKQKESMFRKLQLDEIPANYKIAYLNKSKAAQLTRMMDKTKISIKPGKRFQSWIDVGLYVPHLFSVIDNTAPNYSIIINNSLDVLIDKYDKSKDDYSKEMKLLLIGTKKYILRIIKELDDSIVREERVNKELIKTKEYFYNMLSCRAKTLEEGLQRILFWSSIFWQSQHRLIGLGRLDKILSDLDCPNDEETINIIQDFYQELHRYFAFKSNGRLLGDTGQIIIIGGVKPDGSYFCNSLSYMFIQALRDNPIPDPKILLRVSHKMPEDLLQLAVKCIATGVGCPLLSNDDVVVPALEQFGYSHVDACNYVTSACWEPLAYGKSLEKNNIKCINYAQSIVETYTDESFDKLNTFEEVFSLYLQKLDTQIRAILNGLQNVIWEPNPLMSLFAENCDNKKADISKGGAIYNNYGILTVGMANAVNSLLNIRKFVFIEHKFSLHELMEACVLNYDSKYLDLKNELSSQLYFGKDSKDAIEMTKRIADYTYRICKDWRNPFNGILKWGLSASNYLESGQVVGATMDGRERGKPLATHISNSCGSYTELINFACELDYSGQRSNGNVVDFFVAPDLITNNFDKFVSFIKASILKGFFQMQMNVVSSKTLIAAKKQPELFPNLIVRVWGFSAYFNDLPDEYKDVLIARAVESEKAA